MYVLADFMSTKQHTLCDCSYENENIFIYHEFYLVYSPQQEIAMMWHKLQINSVPLNHTLWPN